jgi:hypothetical protein
LDLAELLSHLAGEARDLLSFRTLIAPGLLLVTYYAGALAIPLLVALYIRRTRRRAGSASDALWQGLGEPAQTLRQGASGALDAIRTSSLGERLLRTRLRILLVGLAGFLLLELMWRVMFEFLIAYFQIREALLRIQGI